MPWLQKARVMLHVHYYETRLFPALRTLRPVMMGLPVVCESSVFSSTNDWSNSGMVFSDVHGLVQACHDVVANPSRGRNIANAMKRYAESLRIENQWQELLETHKRWV
jgi:hypothetical protein